MLLVPELVGVKGRWLHPVLNERERRQEGRDAEDNDRDGKRGGEAQGSEVRANGGKLHNVVREPEPEGRKSGGDKEQCCCVPRSLHT